MQYFLTSKCRKYRHIYSHTVCPILPGYFVLSRGIKLYFRVCHRKYLAFYLVVTKIHNKCFFLVFLTNIFYVFKSNIDLVINNIRISYKVLQLFPFTDTNKKGMFYLQMTDRPTGIIRHLTV